MGRYLPWRDDPGELRPIKRIKTDPSPEEIIAKRKKEKEEKDEDFREDEYMRDGLDHDDKYIMVEDELLQIAKSYTAKLHSAELARLQDQLARRKAQRASQSQSSSQPKITASMSKQRQVILQRRIHDAAVQKAAAGSKATTKDEEQYNPQFSSKSLGRLMTTSAPRIESTLPLPPFPGKNIKPATRAAAGFTKASFKKPSESQISPSQLRRLNSQVAEEYSDDEDDDSGDDGGDTDDSDDDLDVIPKRRNTFQNDRKPTSAEKRPGFKDSDGRISSSKHPPVSSIVTNTVYKTTYPSSIKQLASSPVSQAPVIKSTPLKPCTIPTSITQQRTPGSASKESKAKVIISDSDSDDYADAAQAERWRRRKELAGAQKSGPKS
ncbi:hypothetical protein TWF694_010433 [Orbilia ellipsospora]|uniref:Uncharacterized protein n=1 Tax=Orbilia ellipsospora TaxID=2528407 RepID=A0AAV9XB10_9PEZI